MGQKAPTVGAAAGKKKVSSTPKRRSNEAGENDDTESLCKYCASIVVLSLAAMNNH